jgi:hypothetical protein
MKNVTTLILIAALAVLTGCPEESSEENNDHNNHSHENNDHNNTTGNNTSNNTTGNNTSNNTAYVPPTLDTVPETYAFPSKFVDDPENGGVRYNGQTLRHTIIASLNNYINAEDAGLQLAASQNAFADKAEVLEAFDLFMQSTDLDEVGISTDPAPLQTTFAEIGGGKLIDKLAGNDASTDYKDWNTELQGWEGQTSAQGLLEGVFFDRLADQVIALQEGNGLTDPVSGDALPLYVTAEGHDLKQLIQKFLLMSVTFAQATDDYMASGQDGKGLESPNTQSGDSVYTSLEHVWDEGFGYFGAARNYDTYTDQEIADGATKNYDGDDATTNLKSEYNFGASVNAAKRDLGSAEGAKTDYTQQAFDAFVEGRFIIYNADDTLTAEEKAALEAQRDLAIGAWEKAIAATALHYINDSLQVIRTYQNDKDNYSHATYAKKWSELKGFSLGFQFNEQSPMMAPTDATDDDAALTRFVAFHGLIKDAPVLPDPAAADGGQAFVDYVDDLIAARDILKEAYGFADANIGDENGENGW